MRVRNKNNNKMNLLIHRTALTILILSCFHFTGLSQRILLSKAKVHIGNGRVINQGLVGVEGDKIILVENSLTYKLDESKWDTIIDLRGKELYPGFIAPNSILGLLEVESVRATRDFNEVGEYNPNIRSVIAFNADSEISATTKTNGVLYAQVTPRDGVISGSSSIMKLEAWTWEDGVEKEDDGIHLNWPSTTTGGGSWMSPASLKPNKKYTEQVQNIYQFFKSALAYNKGKDHSDLRFEAMRGVFEGKKRVYVHADMLRQITDIIDFKEEIGIPQLVIMGAYESYKAIGVLKDANIPVILRGMHDLPKGEDDPIDLPYRIPAMLQNAGILFCIQNTGEIDYSTERNLPFTAGTAMAYGLQEEDAVAAITLNAAKIMGVDASIGSIEVGKKASLFVSEGSALNVKTNKVTLGMIDGEFIQLEHHQSRLYEKYKRKYAK